MAPPAPDRVATPRVLLIPVRERLRAPGRARCGSRGSSPRSGRSIPAGAPAVKTLQVSDLAKKIGGPQFESDMKEDEAREQTFHLPVRPIGDSEFAPLP